MVTAICIDGSLQNLGLAVVELDETRITKVIDLILNTTKPTDDKKKRKSYDDLFRFQSHWKVLTETIDKYNCTLSIGEVPSGSQDSRASFAFGGITAIYACLPVPFIPVHPAEVKLAATGFKHSDKEDIITWAYSKYPDANWLTSKRSNKMNIKTPSGLFLKNENEHLADAIAIAYAGVNYL